MYHQKHFLFPRWTMLLCLFFPFQLLLAQKDFPKNDIVFKAIKTELDRSVNKLQKDSLPKPYFMSIKVTDQLCQFSYETKFGEPSFKELDTIVKRNGKLTIKVGNYHRSQSENTGILLPATNTDEKAIRSMIWLVANGLYEYTATSYVRKMADLKQENLSEEEKAIDDFEKRKPVILLRSSAQKQYNFDYAQKISLEIGQKLHKKAKKENLLLENLHTNYGFTSFLERYYNTEGTVYQYPYQSMTLFIHMAGIDSIGKDIVVEKRWQFNRLSQLQEEITNTDSIADELIQLYKTKYAAESYTKSYMGPILITGQYLENIISFVTNNLYTEPKTSNKDGNPYQKLNGVRIISPQLSLLAIYGDKAQETEGVKKDIAPIDEEGVIPPDSIVLVKNGVLKNMFTTRQKVLHYPTSNGNAPRYNNHKNRLLILTGSKKQSYSSLIQQLIDEAKAQGLSYALILDSDDKYHYKVDVQTGKLIPIKAKTNLSNVMQILRRVIAVEDKNDQSIEGTIRFPKSILLEDAQITTHKDTQRLKKNFVPRPEI